MTEEVHLAFRPVQDFVAQARRARDLWAGSYLLSYLAGSALAGLGPGDIVLPAAEGNPMMDALRARHAGTPATPAAPGNRVGSVPHVAELVAPVGRGGVLARDAVAGWQSAWQIVQEQALRRLRSRLAGLWTARTDAIWQRQVEDLWQVFWIVGEMTQMGRRKALRDFDLRAEEGEKCTCCGAREALHGEDGSRRGVIAFWAAAAPHFGFLEIRPDGRERLCAICTIKRVLPDIAEAALGWRVPSAFPSTTTMASLPWRAELLRLGHDDPAIRAAARGLVEALEAAGREPIVLRGAFPGLRETAASWPGADGEIAGRLLGYDGDWFYPELIQGRDIERLLDPPARQAILAALLTLRGAARRAGLADPGTWYAFLAMDGDRLGEILREYRDDKQAVSRALGAFSAGVAELVEGIGGEGRLIYAGGDDVLALLPITTALPVAAAIRQSYVDTFRIRLPRARATISAGLVYAHMHAPLQRVVQTAHRILDDEAKEKAERDALAVAVWKRSGIVLQFAAPWVRDGVDVVAGIEAVRRGVLEREYSRGFLYSLDHLLPVTRGMAADEVSALLTAEYLKSREREVDRATAEQRVGVLQALQPAVGPPTHPALLAAFLASPGEH